VNDLNDRARAQLAEAERDALHAHKRWRARRRRQALHWVGYSLVFLAGAGFTALLIAALRWVP
jgi:hypothetical protein